MRKTFETTGPIEVRARLAAGELDVEAVDTAETVVVVEPVNKASEELIDKVRVELRDSKLIVEAPDHRGIFGWNVQFEVHLRCPTGSRLEAVTASADVRARGKLQRLDIKTASGDIQADASEGETRMSTASGDIDLGSSLGPVDVNTASGDIDIGRASAGLRANLVSGDLSVGEADGGGSVNSVSGDIELGAVGSGSIRANTVSGDVKVAVRPGLDVWMDVKSLSGDTVSELQPVDGPAEDPSRLVELRINTTSGDVRIRRSSNAPVG